MNRLEETQSAVVNILNVRPHDTIAKALEATKKLNTSEYTISGLTDRINFLDQEIVAGDYDDDQRTEMRKERGRANTKRDHFIEQAGNAKMEVLAGVFTTVLYLAGLLVTANAMNGAPEDDS